MRPRGATSLLAAAVAMLVLAWTAAAGAAWAAPPVAMVTDLVGEGRLAGTNADGDTGLTLLAELAPDQRISLAVGARLVIVYYESGNEYAFAGPAGVRIGAGEPEMLSGEAPDQRQVLSVGDGEAIIIQPSGMAQASLVMRGSDANSDLRLSNLVGTKTLERRPLFRWQPLPGAVTYSFELTNDVGETLVETEVDGSEFPLPAALSLEPDTTYTWEVTARTPDGVLHSNWGDFSLATDDERALVERLRPPGGAPFSRRVLFAALLDRMEIKDAALIQWKALLAERRDDPRLRRLAGE